MVCKIRVTATNSKVGDLIIHRLMSSAIVVTPESPTFWKEIAGTPGGEAITTCIQCGSCTSTCPVELLEPKLNIRRILAGVRLGLRSEVLSDESLWFCVRCFRCVARCPKNVSPGDIVEALRHLALKEGMQGTGPRHTRAFVDSVRSGGRIHEARVLLDTEGWAGVLREGLLPLRMAMKGKLPSLRHRPLASSEEVKLLLQISEERE